MRDKRHQSINNDNGRGASLPMGSCRRGNTPIEMIKQAVQGTEGHYSLFGES